MSLFGGCHYSEVSQLGGSTVDDESDVELDGNDLLDLDLEHNDDDFESDLSDSEDRAGSAEEFQWSPTLPELTLA